MVSNKGEAEASLWKMVRWRERKIVFKVASEEANLVWTCPKLYCIIKRNILKNTVKQELWRSCHLVIFECFLVPSCFLSFFLHFIYLSKSVCSCGTYQNPHHYLKRVGVIDPGAVAKLTIKGCGIGWGWHLAWDLWTGLCPEKLVNNMIILVIVTTLTVKTWLYASAYSYCKMLELAHLGFRSSKNSHFQNEAKCKTFLVKMSFWAWD